MTKITKRKPTSTELQIYDVFRGSRAQYREEYFAKLYEKMSGVKPFTRESIIELRGVKTSIRAICEGMPYWPNPSNDVGRFVRLVVYMKGAIEKNASKISIESSPNTKIDEEKIKRGVRLMLEGIGEDINRDGLKETPDRVARMYKECMNGYHIDIKKYAKIFKCKSKNPIIFKYGRVYSFCEHHMLPFEGTLWVAYVPDKHVIGASKPLRIARKALKKFQIQERLTQEIADDLCEIIKPKGLYVVYTATHHCMILRGIRATEATMTTYAMKGKFTNEERDFIMHKIYG